MLKIYLDNLGFVQVNFDFFQEQSFHNLSGQPIPVLDHCCAEIPVPKQNVPFHNSFASVHFAEESGSILFVRSH